MTKKNKFNEMQYRELIEQIPAGIYKANANGIITYCNPWAAKILGFESADHLNGIDLKTLYVKVEDRERFLKSLSSSSVSDNYRVEMRKQTGEHIVVSSNTRRDESGSNVGGVEGVFTDVTDLVNYEKLFEDLPVGVYQLNDSLCITKCNRGFEKIFGYNPEELLGKPASILYADVSEMKRLAHDLKDNSHLNNSVVRSRVIEMKKKDDQNVWISLTTHLRKDNQGRIIGREGAVTETNLEEAVDRNFLNGLCFMALPFSKELLNIYDKVIKPIVLSHDYHPQTALDTVDTDKPIRVKASEMIQKANFVVAEVTGQNPNVMYELGLAHAYDKHVIMISQDDKMPINVSDFEFIPYDNTIEGAEKLRKRLDLAIVTIHKKLNTCCD